MKFEAQFGKSWQFLIICIPSQKSGQNSENMCKLWKSGFNFENIGNTRNMGENLNRWGKLRQSGQNSEYIGNSNSQDEIQKIGVKI